MVGKISVNTSLMVYRCNKNLPHILSIAKQVGKFLSNIGSLPEKTVLAKYIKKELIELLPGPQI